MKTSEVQTITDALRFKATVKLAEPSGGYWDGGVKDRFEFTPALERTPGVPAIRWGSWDANCWFVIPFKTGKQHFAALRRKLRGSQSRTIEISELIATP